MLDNKYTIETPELIELSLSPASFWSRSMAFLLDFLFRFLLYVILTTVFFSLLANYSIAFIFISLFLIEWFYPVYFEVWHDGATPGKKYYRIKVVSDDGTPITFAASMLRNLLRVVDFLPIMYAAGTICSVCNSGFKRVGDLAAGTIVVNTPPLYTPPHIEVTGSQPAPDYLSVADQKAIVAFAERAGSMSQQRRLELANYLSPVFPAKDADLVKTLLETANGITGID